MELFDGEVTYDWPDHVSSSQRVWWTCRLRSALSASGLRRKRVPSKALLIGSVVHDVLGEHYEIAPVKVRSEKRLLTTAAATTALLPWPAVVTDEVLTVAQKMLRTFWAAYGDDGIEMRTEYPLEVPEITPGVSYRGYIDGVWETKDTIYVEDWKTSQRAIEPIKHTFMNMQLQDYAWAMSKLRPDKNVKVSVMLITPTYCQRIDVPTAWKDQAGEELRTLAQEQRTLSPVMHRGGHCMYCDYQPLCLTSWTGRPVANVIDSEYTRENDDDSGEEVAE